MGRQSGSFKHWCQDFQHHRTDRQHGLLRALPAQGRGKQQLNRRHIGAIYDDHPGYDGADADGFGHEQRPDHDQLHGNMAFR